MLMQAFFQPVHSLPHALVALVAIVLGHIFVAALLRLARKDVQLRVHALHPALKPLPTCTKNAYNSGTKNRVVYLHTFSMCCIQRVRLAASSLLIHTPGWSPRLIRSSVGRMGRGCRFTRSCGLAEQADKSISAVTHNALALFLSLLALPPPQPALKKLQGFAEYRQKFTAHR